MQLNRLAKGHGGNGRVGQRQQKAAFLRKILIASMQNICLKLQEVFFRSQLHTPAGVSLISQTKLDWEGVHREPFCY